MAATGPKAGRRRTPERIVETALRLFNDFGEPNVTTTAIADEMSISPGNLYYHFHSKDEIVDVLFARYEQQMEQVLAVREPAPRDAEDAWLLLHLMFEVIWQYRFLYRDLNDLLTRNRRIETHVQRMLARKERTAVMLCHGLVAGGVLQASADDIAALATNITLVATFWLSFEHARRPREAPDIGRGIYQVMSLAAPWLSAPAREQLQHLSRAYVDRRGRRPAG